MSGRVDSSLAAKLTKERVRCKVKIRYRQEEQWATVTPDSSGHAHISFDIPQWAIFPGQAAVFYDGDIVLGGGTVIQI